MSFNVRIQVIFRSQIKLGASLHALNVRLAGLEAGGLARCEFAAALALLDACLLAGLTAIDPRRHGTGIGNDDGSICNAQANDLRASS